MQISPPPIRVVTSAQQMMPMPEARQASAGSRSVEASAADHVHPRLSSATVQTLNGSSQATVVFTRSFDVEPVPMMTAIESGNVQPVVFRVSSWTQDANGKYIGAIVTGARLRPLPGVITLLSGLVGYDISAGSAANVKFSMLVIAQS